MNLKNVHRLLLEHRAKIKSKIEADVKKCPKCPATPGMFKRHEMKARKIRAIADGLVYILLMYLLRWKCPICNRSFTEYPWFLGPHKRYMSLPVVEKVFQYVNEEKTDYRRAAIEQSGEEKKPIWYEQDLDKPDDVRAFAHTTIYRWTGYLGSREKELAALTKNLMGKNPYSELPYLPAKVSPRKYHSEKRKKLLELCKRWGQAFSLFCSDCKEKNIILRFATHKLF